MKLRVKHVEGIGWFAQAKVSIFSKWGRIAEISGELKLYPAENKYPYSSEEEAVAVCKRFREYHKLQTKKATYKTVL